MRVARIEIRERIALDRRAIDEICAALGQDRAERLVGGAMEDMAGWISRVEGLLRRGQEVELGQLALRIEASAARLGMPLLARVAGATGRLCGSDDPAALAAVTGRLVRVGERSLLAVWELEGA